MEDLGQLTKQDERYVFTYPALKLVVRGANPEWVLEAAAEVIAEAEKRTAESQVEELETLIEFGEASEVELDVQKFDVKARFEAVPQCLVSLGDGDFRWIAPVARSGENASITRVHDMSMTRNDTFLVDEQN